MTAKFSFQSLQQNHPKAKSNWMSNSQEQQSIFKRNHPSTVDHNNGKQKQFDINNNQVSLMPSSQSECEESSLGVSLGTNQKVYDTRHISLQNSLITNNRILSSSQILIQNIPPNNVNYESMHIKLNGLEDSLSIMRQRFNHNKEQQDFLKIPLQKQPETIRKSKSNLFQNVCEPFKNFMSQMTCPKNCKQFQFDSSSTQNMPTYYISQVIKAVRTANNIVADHITTSIKIIKVFKNIKGFCYQELLQKKLNLPIKQSCKKTIIFDLDETLIHCNRNSNMPSDVRLKLRHTNGDTLQIGINIRPYACQLLRQLSKTMQVIVFTASHSWYANGVLDCLDPQRKYISHRLFREHCFQAQQGLYIKDLRILNRELSQVILIDNSAFSYILQLQNGVPIIPFYNNKSDTELKSLERYLKDIGDCVDVRDLNRNTFKLGKYEQFERYEDLAESLYAAV